MPSTTTLWTPSSAFQNNSNLAAYQRWLEVNHGLFFPDYHALWEWSTEHPDKFWETIVAYFEVQFYHQPTETLTGEMPTAKWFAGGTLNYAEHIFRNKTDDRPALRFYNETGNLDLSWNDLEQRVIAVQNWLISRGVGQGDRVAAYLPNIPEAIVCFLAANGLGAVWSCCSPDFGVETVIERFTQIEPKVLIVCDGYRYNGKPHDRLAVASQLRKALPTVQSVALVPYLNAEATIPNTALYSELCTRDCAGKSITFTPVPFDHPIWVLYSSGTTGRPKAITHSHGGVLLEHLKYMAFHNDAKAGENFFWFTTTGWMMWNFLQASMLVGAVPVLFDGSPGYPSLDRLWEIAGELPMHHFGTSAPYLTACMKQGLEPKNIADLSALRSIGSTGAPLPPEAFDWVYESVKENIWLCSMSGGTDVCTAFVGGIPTRPVRRGMIQGRALGCALHAFDEAGTQVQGELGEMVITQPMPSMPIYFWNDPENERYRASYFADFPGQWRHGDWIKIEADGQLIIQGRSDATLNRKGVRIGTAEIYRVLDQIPGLADSLVLNLERPDGSDHMPLYVVAPDGLTDELKTAINHELKTQCSPRHVPDEIILAPDIPYTLSGKKMEVPVKKILLGMDVSKSLNRDAVRNPAALDWFLKQS
ncbi:acetoacetate--CoA ligase [Neolewinella persica]|uniref:acetoacetate--CoA ligase n=1 Tax=Neolewinella persica TaxID=70998 RepID=UPI000373D1DE|nr:acetoacetate--CoA ligase [Neolewinella persica]